MSLPRRRFVQSIAATGLLGVVNSSVAHSAERSMPTARELLSLDRTLLVAHRGLPGAAPENSLPAFEAALAHHPDFVELDYRHSSDGVPIVIHDEKLDRTTNSCELFGATSVLIGTKTAAELRRLDAGSWFRAEFARTHLPTLDESIDLVCPRACMMIERKGGDAGTLAELLRKKKVLDRVIVQAFEWSFIDDFHKLEPGVPVGLLGSKQLDETRLAEARRIGADVIGWKEQDLDKTSIVAARAAKFGVWAWTVNKEPRARQLIDWGLDGLITNHADQARTWIAR